MAMSEGGRRMTYIGGGLAGILLLAAWSSSGKAKSKRLYGPGDEVELYMGSMFTVRLQRGRYEILANQVKFVAATDRGNFTDVSMIVGASALPYTEAVRFIDKDKIGVEYLVTVSAKEIPSKGS